MSWASVVKTSEPRTEDVACGSSRTKQCASEVVVDTNALIRGVQLERIAERAVTVREVLGEVRDQKSREWLERMPFGVDVEEPEDEDVKAVTNFARATGDLSYLSKVDVKVIALTRTRERIRNGAKNLKDSPDQVKVQPKNSASGTSQPGWGAVPNPEDWEAVDRLNELEEQGKIAPADTSSQSRILNSLEALAISDNLDKNQDMRQGGDLEDKSIDEHGGQDDTIGTSVMCEAEEVGMQSTTGKGAIEEDRLHSTLDGVSLPLNTSSGEENNMVALSSNEDASGDGWQVAGKATGKKTSVVSCPVQPCKAVESSDKESGYVKEANHSPISCMTSDFSMQNVLIQMGLRVLSPDGRRIREVKRWAMRCTACYAVTKEVGRIFCSKCGNASLQRVEVQTGPNGTELFGVRTRHRVRGTKYSLPMPKGGKRNKDPILSEDVMKERIKHLHAPRKDTSMDAFAPEFSEDTWFKASTAKHQMRDLLPNRRNPNERKHGKRRK